MADSITCPRCGATSHHPMDIEEGYCGNCCDHTSGAFSVLAFKEWVRTGEIPQWRQRVVEARAISEALQESRETHHGSPGTTA